MDQFTFMLLPLLLTCLGCCVGQDGESKGLVEAILGENVTLKVLVEKTKDDVIIWHFRKRDEWIEVATLRGSALQVSDQYEGRASIDPSSGDLTLSSLDCDDSGNYSFNIIGGNVKFSEIRLRILAPTTRSVPTSSYPGALKQCADCAVPLGVCLAVIVLLLLGFLLLFYKMCCGKRSRTSNTEQPNIQERWPANSKCEDSIYDTLDLATMDKDQSYSGLHCRRF